MKPLSARQFSRSVILLITVSVVLLIGFVIVNPNQVITAQTADCNQIVPLAAKNLASSCNGLDQNQACYGNSLVNVDYQDGATQAPFAKVGDIAPLNVLKTITTGPLNTEQNQWGLAALKVPSTLPGTTAGQAVTFLLYGDTKLSGLSQPNATPNATAAVCNATTNRATTLYTQPSFSAPKGSGLNSQTPLNVIGRTSDGAWVQVDNQGTKGWLNPGNLKLNCGLDTVPVVDPTSPGVLGGSGAFYFTTGIGGQATCQNVPAGGLLIRSPSGQKVAFRANGAEITIGSTVLFNAQPNGKMTVSVLNGQASVLSFGQRQTAGTGQTITVPLGNPPLSDRSDGLEVVGPPSMPSDISGDTSQYDAACTLAKAMGGSEACTTVRPTATSTQRFVTKTPIPPTATFTPVPAQANTSCTLESLSASPKALTMPPSGAAPCTTVSWGVEGVNQVFLNGAGVVGHGSQQFCISKTTTFTLTLVCTGGNKSGSVTVTVK